MNREILHEHEMRPHDALQFTVTQPDGSEVVFAMDIDGGFGDFAFDVTSNGHTEHFISYWTNESSIFIDVMQRLLARPADALTEDITRLHTALAMLEQDEYRPTTEGEGKIDTWTLQYQLQRGIEQPARYSMFSGGDDVVVVDATQSDGLHLAIDRDNDGDRIVHEVIVPDEALWCFATGMIARSYSNEFRSYPQLTRIPTLQYMNALQLLLDGKD